MKSSFNRPELIVPLLWTALCLGSVSFDLKNVDQLFPLFSWQLFADYPQAYERSYVFTSPSELNFTKRYEIPLSRKDKKRLWKLGNEIQEESSQDQKTKLV
ncbi:MAG: hypothetical protein NXH75_15850, partial [Halobacteriovoraceae bacterium]|nr:hypothetical protein [Halobacteriovoraceae bacterium]